MESETTAYLHILGHGETKSAVANNKGHLFEALMLALCKHLKMEVTHKNKSENGKEIDLEGRTLVGNVDFFAECKAKEEPLNSEDVQKFGFKFLIKSRKKPDTRGLFFTLSALNSKAQEVWDDDLATEYKDQVHIYFENDIVALLIEHYGLKSPNVIQHKAQSEYNRICGDTLLLCIADEKLAPDLYWAQLLMSTDGTEPSQVAIYSGTGIFVQQPNVVEHILDLKSDLRTSKLVCLNSADKHIAKQQVDDISPARTVVRVRMSSDWFDYRFPSAPQFFVGRILHRGDLINFISDVRNGKTSMRGVVFSGKSGIGKSSLALKARDELLSQKVIFLPIDSRLCDDVSFLFDSVNELILELRQIPELRSELENASVRGLDSLIATLEDIHKAIAKHDYIAVLFFDQFEKVFEYPVVAKAIRNLFVNLVEKQLVILFGFAWKSDLWSLADGFPHQERDDILRESFALRQLNRFDQEETSEIVKQLELQWNGKLSGILRRQIADFTRGLPWLLKQVCSHILEQQRQGITTEELIETNLKLQDLFESQLSGLDDEERSLLREIARLLPTTLQRLSEYFEISNIDQSIHRFIDKRILVKITEDTGGSLGNVKYDVYSDIFREFLITGSVPVDEAFYLFNYPKGAMKFFQKVQQRGTLSVEEEREETGKLKISIYNLSRDLKNLGLVNVRDGVFSLTDDVKDLSDSEIFTFIQGQLKHNRVISLTLSEINENGSIPKRRLIELLQELFPSVQSREKTWETYSSILAAWLHRFGLAVYRKQTNSLHQIDDEEIFETIVDREQGATIGYRLPVCFRNAIIEAIESFHHFGGKATAAQLMELTEKSHQSVEKAISDCLNLGFIVHEQDNSYILTDEGQEFATSSESRRCQIFRQQCSSLNVFGRFVEQIEEAGLSGLGYKVAAETIVKEMEIELADATIDKLGSILANWAEYTGIIRRYGKICYTYENQPQLPLF